jgi:hypothetical protein
MSNLEVIPVKEHIIDGVPAYKYGEWPGVTSNKWKGSIKILRPVTSEKIFDGKFY